MDKRVNSTDGTKVGPLTIIDFILAWVLAYNVVKGGIGFSFNADWNFTSFQSLVLGFAAAWAFVMLMFMPVVGLLIRGGFSLAYTFIICNIIPFSRWVNDSMLWLVPIYIIVFLLCFSLHGASEMDSVPLKKFREKREQSRIKKANKQAEEMMKNLYYQKSNTAGGNYRNPEEEQRRRQYEIEHAKTGDFRDMVTAHCDSTYCYIAAKESNVIIKNSYGGSGNINGRSFQSHALTVETLNGEIIEELYLRGEDFKGFSDKINYLKEKYKLNTCSRFSDLSSARDFVTANQDARNGTEKAEASFQPKKDTLSFTQAINHCDKGEKNACVIIDTKMPAYMALAEKKDDCISISIFDRDSNLLENAEVPLLANRSNDGYKMIVDLQKKYGFSDELMEFNELSEARQYIDSKKETGRKGKLSE